MSKPIVATVLGPDRVGKSTLISKTTEAFQDKDLDVTTLHFSGPQPHHHTPIEQYISPFMMALDTMPDVVLCDRGVSEVCFYEKYRRNIHISDQWAQSAESFFIKHSASYKTFLIKRSWEWAEPHHLVEIMAQYPNATRWFINNQLEMRRKEHQAYYDYMEDYLENRSLVSAIWLQVDDDEMNDLCSMIF